MPNDNLNGDGSRPLSDKRRFLLRALPLALGLWLLAAGTRFWLAPQWERLPADYAKETSYVAHSRYRDTPAGAWQKFDLIARRVDQTLVVSAQDAIIQGDIHWTAKAGKCFSSPLESNGLQREAKPARHKS